VSGLLSRLANRSRDALFLPPFDGLWRRRLSGKVMALLYHRVDQPGNVPFLDQCGVPPIPPQELAGELLFLKDQGATFLTFDDLWQGRTPEPGGFGVIVSFDDGFRDNYSNGLRVLDQLAIPGVLFQATAMLRPGTLIWEHTLYWFWQEPVRAAALIDLARRRFPACRSLSGEPLLGFLREGMPMREVERLLAELCHAFGSAGELEGLAEELYPQQADLVAARQAGHQIGSHGHHHYPRHCLNDEEFEAELTTSRAILAGILGRAPRAFSYPFNSHQAGDEQICGRHFQQVVTVDARPIEAGTSPLSLPRFTWPGPHRHGLHRRRWLWTGRL
jgi:peptidoglycan/xylan/chitin deacetylase (PgdA/CDA1 family)